MQCKPFSGGHSSTQLVLGILRGEAPCVVPWSELITNAQLQVAQWVFARTKVQASTLLRDQYLGPGGCQGSSSAVGPTGGAVYSCRARRCVFRWRANLHGRRKVLIAWQLRKPSSVPTPVARELASLLTLGGHEWFARVNKRLPTEPLGASVDQRSVTCWQPWARWQPLATVGKKQSDPLPTLPTLPAGFYQAGRQLLSTGFIESGDSGALP